eukprot:Selendium_serpulae@DN6450_c2_g1_i2.p1
MEQRNIFPHRARGVLAMFALTLFVATHLHTRMWRPLSALTNVQRIRLPYESLNMVPQGRPVVVAVSSSNLVQHAQNWWYYLGPIAEKGNIDVILIALSDGLCDHFKNETALTCMYYSDLTSDVDDRTVYNSTEYLSNIGKKVNIFTSFVKRITRDELILFSDVDVVFLANPFTSVALPMTDDTGRNVSFWFQQDNSVCVPRQRDGWTTNTGLFFIRRSEEAIEIFEELREELAAKTATSQPVLKEILTRRKTPFFFLPCALFANGSSFFRMNMANSPVAVHANWLKTSDDKRACLEEYDLWFGSRRSTPVRSRPGRGCPSNRTIRIRPSVAYYQFRMPDY